MDHVLVWDNGALTVERFTAGGEARRFCMGKNIRSQGAKIVSCWRNNEGQLVQMWPLPQDR